MAEHPTGPESAQNTGRTIAQTVLARVQRTRGALSPWARDWFAESLPMPLAPAGTPVEGQSSPLAPQPAGQPRIAKVQRLAAIVAQRYPDASARYITRTMGEAPSPARPDLALPAAPRSPQPPAMGEFRATASPATTGGGLVQEPTQIGQPAEEYDAVANEEDETEPAPPTGAELMALLRQRSERARATLQAKREAEAQAAHPAAFASSPDEPSFPRPDAAAPSGLAATAGGLTRATAARPASGPGVPALRRSGRIEEFSPRVEASLAGQQEPNSQPPGFSQTPPIQPAPVHPEATGSPFRSPSTEAEAAGPVSPAGHTMQAARPAGLPPRAAEMASAPAAAVQRQPGPAAPAQSTPAFARPAAPVTTPSQPPDAEPSLLDLLRQRSQRAKAALQAKRDAEAAAESAAASARPAPAAYRTAGVPSPAAAASAAASMSAAPAVYRTASISSPAATASAAASVPPAPAAYRTAGVPSPAAAEPPAARTMPAPSPLAQRQPAGAPLETEPEPLPARTSGAAPVAEPVPAPVSAASAAGAAEELISAVAPATDASAFPPPLAAALPIQRAPAVPAPESGPGLVPPRTTGVAAAPDTKPAPVAPVGSPHQAEQLAAASTPARDASALPPQLAAPPSVQRAPAGPRPESEPGPVASRTTGVASATDTEPTLFTSVTGPGSSEQPGAAVAPARDASASNPALAAPPPVQRQPSAASAATEPGPVPSRTASLTHSLAAEPPAVRSEQAPSPRSVQRQPAGLPPETPPDSFPSQITGIAAAPGAATTIARSLERSPDGAGLPPARVAQPTTDSPVDRSSTTVGAAPTPAAASAATVSRPAQADSQTVERQPVVPAPGTASSSPSTAAPSSLAVPSGPALLEHVSPASGQGLAAEVSPANSSAAVPVSSDTAAIRRAPTEENEEGDGDRRPPAAPPATSSEPSAPPARQGEPPSQWIPAEAPPRREQPRKPVPDGTPAVPHLDHAAPVTPVAPPSAVQRAPEPEEEHPRPSQAPAVDQGLPAVPSRAGELAEQTPSRQMPPAQPSAPARASEPPFTYAVESPTPTAEAAQVLGKSPSVPRPAAQRVSEEPPAEVTFPALPGSERTPLAAAAESWAQAEPPTRAASLAAPPVEAPVPGGAASVSPVGEAASPVASAGSRPAIQRASVPAPDLAVAGPVADAPWSARPASREARAASAASTHSVTPVVQASGIEAPAMAAPRRAPADPQSPGTARVASQPAGPVQVQRQVEPAAVLPVKPVLPVRRSPEPPSAEAGALSARPAVPSPATPPAVVQFLQRKGPLPLAPVYGAAKAPVLSPLLLQLERTDQELHGSAGYVQDAGEPSDEPGPEPNVAASYSSDRGSPAQEPASQRPPVQDEPAGGHPSVSNYYQHSSQPAASNYYQHSGEPAQQSSGTGHRGGSPAATPPARELDSEQPEDSGAPASNGRMDWLYEITPIDFSGATPAPADRPPLPLAMPPAVARIPAPNRPQERRVEPDSVTASPGAAASEQQSAPALDLDALARQVLPRIKRMLAVERERRPAW